MDIKNLMSSLEQSPLYGNKKYGQAFDDAEPCNEKCFPFPVQITIRKGAVIDKLAFAYDGLTTEHGGNGGTPSGMTLQEGEHIVKVCGTHAKFNNDDVIETLSFTTDKGRSFSAGTPKPGNGYFEYKARDGYAICALHGRSANYVGGIGFYARKIELDFLGEKSDR